MRATISKVITADATRERPTGTRHPERDAGDDGVNGGALSAVSRGAASDARDPADGLVPLRGTLRPAPRGPVGSTRSRRIFCAAPVARRNVDEGHRRIGGDAVLALGLPVLQLMPSWISALACAHMRFSSSANSFSRNVGSSGGRRSQFR